MTNEQIDRIALIIKTGIEVGLPNRAIAYSILEDDAVQSMKEPYQPPKSNHLEENLISVGYYKHEIDFGVRCDVYDLPESQFIALLDMLNTAVRIAKEGWARAHNNQLPVQDGKEPK